LESLNYTETLGVALEEAQIKEPKAPDDGLIHLSTGVVLSPRKISPFIFQEVANKFKEPEVPVVWVENKQRNEPNPMHPEYLKAKEMVEVNRSMATIDATIALGTKLELCPQDVPAPESEDWLDDLEAAGIVIDRKNVRLRYRTWVKYMAAPTVDDVQIIISKVLKAIE